MATVYCGHDCNGLLGMVTGVCTVQVMGNQSEFIRAVQLIVDNISFSGPCTTVQVFEVTIR